jgi:hypothetical protein
MSYVPVQEVIEGVGIVDCSLVVAAGEGCVDLWWAVFWWEGVGAEM